jgi:hypothetical protein
MNWVRLGDELVYPIEKLLVSFPGSHLPEPVRLNFLPSASSYKPNYSLLAVYYGFVSQFNNYEESK